MLVAALFAVAVAQGADPGKSSSLADHQYPCNFGETHQRQVLVHSSPNARSRVVAYIKKGDSLYVCDETRSWYQLRFGRDTACAEKLPLGLNVRKAQTCRSGWARKTDIDIVSG